ncbi:MAG: glycosyltransferase [Duncaniella sp.]|nr:glycosyltransferase [Duncaniella sp.]
MKIFYYCLEYPTPMYLWQRANIIGDLRRAGHEVIHFNPATYGSMDAANEAAAAALRSTQGIDLFMTCDDSDTVYPETVREVAKLGIPSLMIAWDNLELPYKQKAIAPLFDAVWLTSDETRYLFERWGCRNVIFAPYACSPYTYGPVETASVRSVGFIGSPYGSRTNKLNHLTSGGVDVDVYANVLFDKGYTSSSATGRKEFSPRDIMVKASRYMRFPIGRKVFAATIINKLSPAARLDTGSEHFHAHRSVSHEEMCRLYSAHTLSLNITELRDTYVLSQPIPKLHLRTFEIPMCGGLQLTSRNPEIEQYFEDGREIVLYDSREEMIDKARWYLDPARDTDVARMKAAARTRAEREHTWMARLNPIFASLGLNH